MMKEAICAVVVSYNRKFLLLKCLNGLLKQTKPLDGICLIDNASTDGTPELLKSNGFLGELPPKNLVDPYHGEYTVRPVGGKAVRIHYVRMHKNTGGAGGFYEGVKFAYEKGYDWIWIMDDDVTPEEDCLSALYEKTYELERTGLDRSNIALSCARFDKEGAFVSDGSKRINLKNPFKNLHEQKISPDDLKKKFQSIEGATFEGLMINRHLVEAVGLPNKEFFIYGDDTEFCLRLLKVTKIYLIPTAKIVRERYVKKGENINNWKRYYILRNMLYIDLKYGNISVKLIRPTRKIVKSVLGRLYHREFVGLITIFKSIRDAFKMLKICKYNTH